nr:uncharacterized protein LOC131779006 isoform X1 [Pocillopora verrucosa]
MAMCPRMCWKLFLLAEVLPVLTQGRQNQSDVSHIKTSISPSPTITAPTSSIASPIKDDEDLNANREGNIVSPHEFKGRFAITNIDYKPQYANVKSDEYKTLKDSLEKALDSSLENTVPGYIMCAVRWFYKGSVITDFVVFVNGNENVSPEELQKAIVSASSTGSLANFKLKNVVIESPQDQRSGENEDNKGSMIMIELWMIITFGGIVIVIVLLFFILGLLIRNRLLKKALTQERRVTEDLRHQQQLQQEGTRETLSIVAASSTDELTTMLDSKKEVKKYQSRSFSIGTSRSAERLMELLKDSDQVKTATGERAERNSSTVFSGSATVPSVISNVSAHEGEFSTSSSLIDDVTMSGDHTYPRKVPFAMSKPLIFISPPKENTVSTAKEDWPQDEETQKEGDESEFTKLKYTPAILQQVQAFEQGTINTSDEEENDKNKLMRSEPKKLRHISLSATASQQMNISEERRRREHEIRPLGGVIKRFALRPSDTDNSATE